MSVLLKNNYHVHTYRCGHAKGSEEEYVIAAIDCGFKTIGFSDHIFLPGFPQPGIRGDFEQLDDYIKTLKKLRRKYKKQINILIGFEAEYIEQFIPYYKDLLKNKGVDFLILGQHCYIYNNKYGFYNSHHHSEEMVNLYVEHLIKGMESGLFSFVCHPDHYLSGYVYWDDFAIQAGKRIIEASIKYDCPLEININGIRAKHAYPNDMFWELVSNYKDVKVIINSDAHSPNQLNDYHEEAFALANKYKLNIEEEMRLKKI